MGHRSIPTGKQIQMIGILSALLLAGSGFGQMSLVSTSPVDGSVSVGLPGTMQFTFSQPIDTTAEFHFNDDSFFMNIEIYPQAQVKKPRTITLGTDLKTVTLNDLQLEADVKYVLLLSGVRSTTGEILDKPAVITFTTGFIMIANVVSGKITYPGGDPTQAVVQLLRNTMDGPEIAAATVITSADGRFTIPYVNEGDYFCASILDANQDGKLEPESGDIFGVFDLDYNHFADEIHVGTIPVTGIDFNIKPVTRVSAQFPLEILIPYLNSLNQGFQLFQIEGINLNELGNAPMWGYGYRIPNAGLVYTFRFIGDWIILDGIYPVTSDPEPIPPDYWINSTEALSVAEVGGGSLFRAAYPDWKIFAVLGPSQILASGGGLAKSGSLKVPGLQLKRQTHRLQYLPSRLLKSMDLRPDTPLSATGTYWLIFYESDTADERLVIFIDAQTGRMLDPQTAGANLAAVKAEAAAKAADARLSEIYSFEMEANGTSQVWVYHFVSETRRRQFDFIKNGSGIVLVGEDTLKDNPPRLGDSWIDSDEAVLIAENQGGSAFRASHPDYAITGVLGASPIMNNTAGSPKGAAQAGFYKATPKSGLPVREPAAAFEQAYWFFAYWSHGTQEEFTIEMDATTGQILGPTTARASVGKAALKALDWSPDAVLTSVYSFVDTLDIHGRSKTWYYYYYSTLLDSNCLVIAFNGSVKSREVLSYIESRDKLTDGWLDSDAAIDKAESFGGKDFRDTQNSVSVYAYLSTRLVQAGIRAPYWSVDYRGSNDTLTIDLHAETGDLLTDVDTEAFNGSPPESFGLRQNYPNPFNPETGIQYQIAHPERVRLRVIDLEGRVVAVLVDERKNPGSYTLRWNGRDLNDRRVSSGIYICELRSGRHRQTKKMVVMK